MNVIRQAFENWVGRKLERVDSGYTDELVAREWNAWSAACHWMREHELEDVERLVKERLEAKK